MPSQLIVSRRRKYFLRPVLKATLYAARNCSLRVAELVLTSSRAKTNNSLARNKLNSDFFFHFIALRSRRAASWPRGVPGFAWSYFALQRVPRLSQSQESATTTILDYGNMRVENPFLQSI